MANTDYDRDRYGNQGYGNQGYGNQGYGQDWRSQGNYREGEGPFGNWGPGYYGYGNQGYGQGWNQGYYGNPGYYGQGYGQGWNQGTYYGNQGWGNQGYGQGHGQGWSQGRSYGQGYGGQGYGQYGQGTYGTNQPWRERGRFTGVGPQNYQRSDHRIQEDINDRLTEHPDLDARNVNVQVQNGEVTLNGWVNSRRDKRIAEDIADSVSGVKNVSNNLSVQPQHQQQPDWLQSVENVFTPGQTGSQTQQGQQSQQTSSRR